MQLERFVGLALLFEPFSPDPRPVDRQRPKSSKLAQQGDVRWQSLDRIGIDDQLALPTYVIDGSDQQRGAHHTGQRQGYGQNLHAPFSMFSGLSCRQVFRQSVVQSLGSGHR